MSERFDSQTARPAVGPTSERPPHLARLDHVWIKRPIYFITSCTQGRDPLLANDTVHRLFSTEWQTAEIRHGWRIGRYVIMPDHVHFFCAALPEAKPLAKFMQRWKEWTGKSVLSALRRPAPLWQHRFFDHVLRTPESYAEKWSYVSQNPVRAGLSATPEAWPYSGHIHFDSPM